MIFVLLILVLLVILQTQVDSTQFVNFFCEHVLPHWNEITSPEGIPDPKLELLKIFAEVTEHTGDLEKPQEKIDAVYALLMVSNFDNQAGPLYIMYHGILNQK